MTKIRVIYESTQCFGGLYLIQDAKEYKQLLELCDKELGIRSSRGGGYNKRGSIERVFDQMNNDFN